MSSMGNVFYGILFFFLTYLINIPAFDVTVIPGLTVPIPNPLYVFQPFSIVTYILGFVSIAVAVAGDDGETQKEE